MNKSNISAGKAGSDVPMFLLKLVDLLKAKDFQKYVSWNDNGTSFIINDQESFSKFVLPKYFKHNKFQSFVRQLNLYGFRKVTSINHGLYSQPEVEEFRHPFFLKERSDLLPLIKRKVSLANKHTEEISQVLEEINEIKDTQMEITNSLLDVKRENDDLWREVVSLRQKHAQQQKVVNHLVKFLVSLVQHHGMGRKRRLPISWKDDSSDGFDPSCKVVNKASGDSTGTTYLKDIVNAEPSSPDGPLITELLSTSSLPNTEQSSVVPASSSKSLNDSNDFDISELIDSIGDSDDFIKLTAVPQVALPSDETSNSLSLVSTNSDNLPTVNNLSFSNASTPTATVVPQSAVVLSPTSTSLPFTNSDRIEVEPNLFLNIPSNSPTVSSVTTTPLSNALAISGIGSSAETPVVSKSILSIPTPIYKKKAKIRQSLNSNMKKIENNLQNIQNRLNKSDKYQLDYDMLEDLFNGQAILPPPTGDSNSDLPIPISLSQDDQNELVPYTGDSILDLTSNDDEETDLDDLSSLLC